MHDYTETLIWYAIWPVLVYTAYRFVLLNLKHHSKMEKLEALEQEHSTNIKKQITYPTSKE